MATNGKIFETELAQGSSDPKYLRAISSDGKSVKVLASQFAKQTTQTQINTRVTTLEGEVDELQTTLPAQVAQIGLNLDELAEEVANNHPECNEAGEYHTDENLNVTYKYTSEGFDAAKLSSHFLSMISNGMAIGIAEMNEDGFAIVGENLNIAFLVDENGAHAANILEYENL